MECDSKRDKPVVVIWSGGFDSTYLIAKMLKDHRDVIAITIDHQMTGINRLVEESQAVKNLTPLLEKLSEDCSVNISFHTLTVSNVTNMDNGSLISFDNAYSDCYGGQIICQPVFWLCNALPLLPNGCEISLSYIAGDRSLSKLSYIENIIENAAKVMNKSFTVTTPLIYKRKADILFQLREIDEKFIDICYSCEYVYRSRCGGCVPFINVRDALIDLTLKTESLYGNSRYWRGKLAEWFNIDVTVGSSSKLIKSASVVQNCSMCGTSYESSYADEVPLSKNCSNNITKVFDRRSEHVSDR